MVKKLIRKTVPRVRTGAGSSRPRPQVNKGTASITCFYYGDSKYTTIAQETLKLKKCMDGYNRTVLLKHETVPSWLDLSEADERRADIKDLPTKANLKRYICDLANEGYMLDLYIFAHGSPNSFTTSRGSHGQDDYMRAADITGLPAQANLSKLPIRAVYQGQCYGQSLISEWRSIGAKVVAGARGVTFYPHGFGNFIKDWNKRTVTFNAAVRDSQTGWVRTTGQASMQVHATTNRGKWGGCPFGKTILGKHKCAKAYFREFWYSNSEWRQGDSGKQNMNHSSHMFVGGSTGITKASQPSW